MPYLIGLDITDKINERVSGSSASQLLQWDGSEWQLRGDTNSTPLYDTYTGSMTVVGAKHLTWDSDGGGNIGASGANRPATAYIATSVIIAGQTAMKAGDSTGGDLSGTYPTSLTVAKLQGRTVASTVPTDGQVLMWNNGLSQWEPASITSTVPSSTQASSILRGDGAGGWVEETDFEVDASGNVVDGTWQADAIGSTYGGTGQTAVAVGDLLYGSGVNTWSRLAKGTNGFYLHLNAGTGALEWSSVSGTLPASTQASSILRGDGGGGWVEETDFEVDASGNVVDGTWQADVIANTYGGTGQNSSGSSGIALVTGGTWSFGATLANLSNVYDSMASTDEFIMYYDGPNARWDSKYPAMVNESAAQTFVVLAAGTSIANINSALASYDVVYLEPGGYTTDGSVVLAIPTGKALIGLGEGNRGGLSGLRVLISITGDPTGTSVVTMANARLENVCFTTGAGFNLGAAKYIVEGTSGVNDRANFVRGCYFYASGAGSDAFAMYGYFIGIEDIGVVRYNGIYLAGDAAIGLISGLHYIRGFYIANAPTYGIRLGAVNFVSVSSGRIEGASGTTNYGIFWAESSINYNHFINTVTINECGQDGIHYSRTGSNSFYHLHIDNCHIDCNSFTSTGIYLDHVYRSFISNASALAATGTGIYFVSSEHSFISNVRVVGASSGVRYDAASYWAKVDNLFCYDQSSYGLWMASSNYVLSNITTFSCATYGVYLPGSNGMLSNVFGLEDGTTLYASGDRITVSNITAYNCTSYGVYLYGVYKLVASNIYSYSAANYGIAIYQCDLAAVSNIGTEDGGNHGIWISGCSYSTFSGLTSFNDGDSGSEYGVYLASSDYSSFVGITVAGATAIGLYLDGLDYCSVTGFSLYSNGTYGIYTTSTMSRVVVSCGVTFGNGTAAGYFTNLGTANCLVHGIGYTNGAITFNNWATADNQNWA